MSIADSLIIEPRDKEPTRIPVDRSREFDQANYPRDPGAYHMWWHFRQRMKDDERFLSGKVINRCITEGGLKDNGDGCAAFHWTREGDGVQYWFLAGLHYDGYLITVTAWPYLRSRRKAIKRGWDSDDLDVIEAFNEKSRNYSSVADDWSSYIEWMTDNGVDRHEIRV